MAFTIKATAIVPKGFDVGKIRDEIAKVLADEGEKDKAMFNKTIDGWGGEKPTMAYETKIKSNEASVWIGPKGSESSIEKWRRLDEGTEEHDISAVNAPRLAFPYQGKGKSYLPKTKPRQFSSSGPGRKLGPIVKPKSVRHPGNEPREWSKTLGEQRIGPFAENVQAAIARGLA